MSSCTHRLSAASSRRTGGGYSLEVLFLPDGQRATLALSGPLHTHTHERPDSFHSDLFHSLDRPRGYGIQLWSSRPLRAKQ